MYPRPLFRRLLIGLCGALAVAAGCVTQTVQEPQGPQWQPGMSTIPPPTVHPPPQPATAPPAKPADPPAEPAVGQLQLLSPAEPADFLADRSPNPVVRAADPLPPGRSPLTTPPRIRQFYSYAAIYGAGRCRFASCAQGGWNTPHSEGDSESRCHAGDCLTQGWTTIHPDGTTVETRCHPGSCLQDGWSTTYKGASDDPAGRPTQTRCQAPGCLTSGWSTLYPDGTTAETRCLPAGCLHDGWSTRLPSGDTIQCHCSLQDCAKNGANCT